MHADFVAFAARKTREAAAGRIDPLVTIDDRTGGRSLRAIGNDWSRRHYDGDFHLVEATAGLPVLSLVFVQSRDGNTGADNPADLGGGDTDRHLIYEGLSRVAADAVLAGAATTRSPDVFFSVWHPELVALRLALGLPRHPAQIVVSETGDFDADGTRLFNVPEVPVFVLAGERCRIRQGAALATRPWVTVVPFEPRDLRRALASLGVRHGIGRISVVGGRRVATSLIDAGLVQDLCLTTTPDAGGEPDTPFYTGTRPPALDVIVRKQSRAARPMLFEQFLVRRDR
jgi:riboflavin biosynthesis pyrimidine reductase